MAQLLQFLVELSKRNEFLAYLLAGVVVLAIAVLVGLGHAVPAELTTLLTLLAGGALGLTSPSTAAKGAPPATSAPAQVLKVEP